MNYELQDKIQSKNCDSKSRNSYFVTSNYRAADLRRFCTIP